MKDLANRYVFVPGNEYESYRRWKEGGKSAVTFDLSQDFILGTIKKE